MLLLPGHLPLPTLMLESQQEAQDNNIQNCSQHGEDYISHFSSKQVLHANPQTINLTEVDQKQQVDRQPILRTM